MTCIILHNLQVVEDKPFFNKFFVHTYDFLIPQQHHELMLKPIMRECILQKDKAFYVCEPQKWSINYNVGHWLHWHVNLPDNDRLRISISIKFGVDTGIG